LGYPVHGPFPHPAGRALFECRGPEFRRVVGVCDLVNDLENIFVGQNRPASTARGLRRRFGSPIVGRCKSGEKTMISAVVLYPNKAGSKFDLNYYVHRHLPLVRDRMQPMGMPSLTYTVEHAMDPKAPSQAYRLSAELRFDDMESAARALEAHGPETQADIPNFTDVAPVILIGEVQQS
jgi:uncharacterized protein (TIGR02118 family)